MGGFRSRWFYVIAILLFCVGCGHNAVAADGPNTPKIAIGVPVPGSPRPQLVRVVKMEFRGGEKIVEAVNDKGRFSLGCTLRQKSCITPVSGGEYFLFTKGSAWQWPGAKQPVSLKFYENWSGSYKGLENVALVPATRNQAGQYGPKPGFQNWGIFWVDWWKGK